MSTNQSNIADSVGNTNRNRKSNRRVALELALASGEELDDGRLLQVILLQHLDEQEAIRIADILLERFQTLADIVQSELAKLLEVKGLTFCAAVAIVQIRQLSAAVTRASLRGRPLFNDSEQIKAYCKSVLCRAKSEEFHALFLDRRGVLLGHECLQTGTIDHVSVYPREVLRHLIRHNASHLILVHNHPFGNARPSRADVGMTRELTRLANAVGASVFDHIIVSPDGCYSFRETRPDTSFSVCGTSKAQ